MNKNTILGALLASSALATNWNERTGRYLEYNARHGKNYATLEEFAMREARYVANDDRISAFNAEEHSWTIGHNKFSDWTTEEYENMLMKDRQEIHPEGAAVNIKSSRSASYATSDHLDSYTCDDCSADVVNVEWSGDASGLGTSVYPNFPIRDQD
jgi:hypothetical protein